MPTPTNTRPAPPELYGQVQDIIKQVLLGDPLALSWEDGKLKTGLEQLLGPYASGLGASDDGRPATRIIKLTPEEDGFHLDFIFSF